MSNTKNSNTQSKSTVSTSEAAEVFNKLQTGQDTKVSFDEAFDILDAAEEAGLKDLTSNYFKFEKVGQKESFVVTGFDMMNTANGLVKVAKLVTRDGEAYVNGEKMLVGACERLEILPAFIKVTYEGDVKNTKGTYKKLLVKTFPVS